jgi:hypothetical protein
MDPGGRWNDQRPRRAKFQQGVEIFVFPLTVKGKNNMMRAYVATGGH